MRGKRRTGISSEVRNSVSTIAVLLALPVIAGLFVMILYSSRYQGMIRRMDAAAELLAERFSAFDVVQCYTRQTTNTISFMTEGTGEFLLMSINTSNQYMGELQLGPSYPCDENGCYIKDENGLIGDADESDYQISEIIAFHEKGYELANTLFKEWKCRTT